MDIQDVIQEFVDGEPVDPVALERALADPDGRAHLIDIVVLRKLVKRSHVAAPMSLAEIAAARTDRPSRGSLRAVAAAAVVAIATSVGGYLVGERIASSRTESAVSPTMPVGTDAAKPGTETALSEQRDLAGPAPAPTVVIRFQPGVDWTEIEGGH